MTRHTRDQQTTNDAGHISDRTPTTPGRQIHLPCFGITVHLAQESSPDSLGRGSITSQLKEPGRGTLVCTFNAAIDGLEALILAHACAGVDITSPAYIEGIETAVDAIGNHL